MKQLFDTGFTRPDARVLISNLAKFNVVALSLAIVLRFQKMLSASCMLNAKIEPEEFLIPTRGRPSGLPPWELTSLVLL